jgi:PD-(D/E)XK endonuclease
MMLEKPLLTHHPVDIGQRSEAAIQAELVKRGYRVLVPIGVNQRYDLVIDMDGRFVKAQCKTARLRNGAIQFSTRSTRSTGQGVQFRSYDGEIDLFLVYSPDTDCVYGVPIEEAAEGQMSLRTEAPQNHQRRGIRWARDYLLPA